MIPDNIKPGDTVLRHWDKALFDVIDVDRRGRVCLQRKRGEVYEHVGAVIGSDEYSAGVCCKNQLEREGCTMTKIGVVVTSVIYVDVETQEDVAKMVNDANHKIWCMNNEQRAKAILKGEAEIEPNGRGYVVE